jgi:Ribonuclease G/E
MGLLAFLKRINMAFKSRKELGGQVDPNINTEGRIKSSKVMTKRELKEKELLMLARKIKPLMAEAINVSAKVMRDEKATHASQLKASALLLSVYQQLIDDLYEGKEDETEDSTTAEIQPQAPLFSLKVIEE